MSSSVAAALVVLLSGPGADVRADLRSSGDIVVSLVGGLSFYSDDDIADLYGPNLATSGSPKGMVLGAGLGYAVSDRVTLGVIVEPVVAKRYTRIKNIPGGGTSDNWTVDATGLLARARLVLPSIETETEFALAAAGGWYWMQGGEWTRDGVSGSGRLEGSRVGAQLAIEMARSVSPMLSFCAELGYRLAAITPVGVSGELAGMPATTNRLTNSNGTRATFDLSGIYLRAGLNLRFRIPEAP